MCLELYRTHLDGLDLSENEMIELQETLIAIVTNVVDNLFKGLDDHECSQR